MSGYRIHIQGQVQGVGFRPHVFRLAKSLNLNGWINNGSDGVHIHIGGTEQACQSFIDEMSTHPPALAHITKQRIESADKPKVNDFHIIESENDKDINLLITPDLGLCEDCRKEIHEQNNRRKNYAFTTCINCGPRYSITETLPYDRCHTAMSEFVMCEHCESEYNSSSDRRYFSQTNSCPSCGVTLSLLNNEGITVSTDDVEIFSYVSHLLSKGKIIAVKGIGGFLLLCDATNEKAVAELRYRKHRPSKPFAVLYPSLEDASKDVFISDRERKELQSIISPIVLLQRKKEIESGICFNQVSPKLSKIGVMLPYTPSLELIVHRWKKPLVATSGNISGSPIYYQDDLAIEHLSSIADFFLTNNRKILVPQDDSVVQFARDQRIVLRRSRGLAPTYLPNPFVDLTQTIFAAGSDMKSSFAIQAKENLYVSQYLGDLENFDSQKSYRDTIHHFKKILRLKPQQILIDKHPSHYSSSIGRELADSWNASITTVQHHLAHFSAVLAENNLLKTDERILGIVWDGTGWGDDGNLWGSEFFIYDANAFERVAHLDYYPHLSGDKMSREPRLSVLSLYYKMTEAEELLRSKYTNEEWRIYHTMLDQPDSLKTSSMGRLFDAVASLLGLCDKTSYEGEAALLLESCASKVSYQVVEYENQSLISLSEFLTQIIIDIQNEVPKETLAYRFHVALVNWIEAVALKEQVLHLAFSGGVFQNALLNKLIRQQLGNTFHLFFHKQLSCNDECIGLGQLAYHQIMNEVKTKNKLENELILK